MSDRWVTLVHPSGASLTVSERGATWVSWQVPERAGPRELLLGFDTADAYRRQGAWMGAVCGRYANRIAGGHCVVAGKTLDLPHNDGVHHLHGGPEGFDTQAWTAAVDGLRVTFSRRSPDGEGGYPGALPVTVSYILGADRVRMEFHARTTAPTPLNLTVHPYFNLGDTPDIRGHRLRVAAARFLPTDNAGIPTGIAPVEGTRFDLRGEVSLGASIAAGGLDHCFLGAAAELREPVSGRSVAVSSSAPGLQVYTGAHLGAACRGLGSRGNGGDYEDFAGVALEAQRLPDAPNRRGFGPWSLRPRQRFSQWTEYRWRPGP